MGRIDISSDVGSISFGSLHAWDYLVALANLPDFPESIEEGGEGQQVFSRYDAAGSKRIAEALRGTLPDVPDEFARSTQNPLMTDYPGDPFERESLLNYWGGRKSELLKVIAIFDGGPTLVFFDC